MNVSREKRADRFSSIYLLSSGESETFRIMSFGFLKVFFRDFFFFFIKNGPGHRGEFLFVKDKITRIISYLIGLCS